MSQTISAVIPAYNAAGFLPGAVESIWRQTIAIDEIIIVDDGSIDATAVVVKSLQPNVIYYHQENSGPAQARNVGIDIARGDFIAFLDADDRWTEDKISDQLAAFAHHPELALVASDMREVDLNGAVLTPSMLEKHGQLGAFLALSGAPIPRPLPMLLKKNFIPTGTVMVRRSVLRDSGGFNCNIRYGEDLELWARIASHNKIACLPKVHLMRSLHSDNTSKSTGPMLHHLVEVMKCIHEECEEAVRSQGGDSRAALASAWADLGYWQFVEGDYFSARKAMIASLDVAFSKRALAYAIASGLPPRIIINLRRLKQRFMDVSKT